MAKVTVQKYKKSINESAFSSEQIAMVWDFYVTKAIAQSAAQQRTASDYGHKSLPWKEMQRVAQLAEENVKVLPANSINKTLANLDLCFEGGKGDNKRETAIEIDVPRIACITPYSIADEEPPKPRVGDAESVLTHIRNAFAHGNTYYFDNQYVLLEDKDQRGAITARIILSQQTLLDWIGIIDNQQRYYIIHQTNQQE